MVCHEPTSTGTGMSRPRPLAASSAATAVAVEGVGADAVTVSVGSTTSRPPLSGADRRRDARLRAARDRRSRTASVIGLSFYPCVTAVTKRGRPARSRRAVMSANARAGERSTVRRRGGVVVLDAAASAGPQQPCRQLDDAVDDGHAVRRRRTAHAADHVRPLRVPDPHRRECRAGWRPAGRRCRRDRPAAPASVTSARISSTGVPATLRRA